MEDDLNLIKKLDNIEKITDGITSANREAILQKTFGLENNEENDTIFVSNLPQNGIEKNIQELFVNHFGEI